MDSLFDLAQGRLGGCPYILDAAKTRIRGCVAVHQDSGSVTASAFARLRDWHGATVLSAALSVARGGHAQPGYGAARNEHRRTQAHPPGRIHLSRPPTFGTLSVSPLYAAERR